MPEVEKVHFTTPEERQQRREYYEAKPHKALELLVALENLEDRYARVKTATDQMGSELLSYVYHPEYEMGFNDGAKAMRERFATMGIDEADDV